MFIDISLIFQRKRLINYLVLMSQASKSRPSLIRQYSCIFTTFNALFILIPDKYCNFAGCKHKH